jgi:TBC1 domain family member 15
MKMLRSLVRNFFFVFNVFMSNVSIYIGAEIAEDAIDEWSIINQITFKPAVDSISFITPKVKNLRIPLVDIKQFKVQGPQLLLFNRNDEHIVTYNFKRSNPISFVRYLQNLQLLKLNFHEKNVYMVKDPQFEKLQRSFAELNIEEIKHSRTPNRPFFMPGYEFLSSIGNNVLGRREHHRKLLDARPGALRFEDSASGSSETNQNDEKVLKKVEIVKNHLPERKSVKRDNPLTQKQWQEFMTQDGRVSDPDRLKEIIFHGGIEPSLRAEVWKYLLNYDLWEHTKDERDERRKQLAEEYERMKLQWVTMSKIQEKNHSGKNLI